MADHPEPPSLTLARTIHDLLAGSGALLREQHAALAIARELLDAGPRQYASNADANNPDAITALNPHGGPRAVR